MKNEYRTRDLAESSALIVYKQQLLRMEQEGHTYWFVFVNKNECEQISSRYFFGELLVSAREFKETMDRLKNRIFAKG